MNKKLQEILLDWQKYVAPHHHKDRDCHFQITINYSYGQKPTYSIDHYAYIGKEIHEIGIESLKEAEKILYKSILGKIRDEFLGANEILKYSKDFERDVILQAKKAVELNKKYDKQI